MRRLFVYIAATLTMLLLFSATAAASTVIKLDLPQLVAHSDAIVVAQVQDTESKLESDGRVYTTITFSTRDIVKGEVGATFSIRQIGGVDGDIATRVPGMPDFRDHEKVFLFLTNFEENPVITGLSQGKFRVALGPDNQTEFVVPEAHQMHLIEGRTNPRPSPEPSPVESAIPELTIQDHTALFEQVHEFSTFRDQVEKVIDAQREVSQ